METAVLNQVSGPVQVLEPRGPEPEQGRAQELDRAAILAQGPEVQRAEQDRLRAFLDKQHPLQLVGYHGSMVF